METDPPKDRYKLIFLVLVLHGIGTLTPWNMFITAKDYFVDYKLSSNYTGKESPYAANFLPYIGFASQIPNVLFNWLNIFVNLGGDLTKRVVWSLVIEIIVFTFTVILAMVDSSSWPDIFFWATMASVVVLNSEFKCNSNCELFLIHLILNLFSGWRYFPEYSLWYECQITRKIHRSCCVGIKY